MDLLIIGLDGLSENMLERFEVEVPPLRRIQREGVAGDLMSVDTPTTIPAWTSFATGTDPGTHGVHSMKRISSTYEHGPATVNSSTPAIYDYLDDAIFINLPASAGRIPAGKRTYVQSSLLSADKTESTPAELQKLETFEDYIPVHNPKLKSRPDRYLDHVREIARTRANFAIDAFETHDPRVGFVLFSTTDWAGHILSKLKNDDERQRFYSELVGEVSAGVEQLLPLADNVLLMSDHGFERKDTTVHLADWLAEEGHLVEQTDTSTASPLGRVTDVAANGAVAVAKAISRRSNTAYRFVRFLHNRLLGTDVGAKLQEAARPTVDYPNSTVFHLRYGCLYINDERFVNPQVTGPAVEDLQDELISELETLTDENGDPLFRAVLTPDEAYADPGSDVPDVIPRPAPGKFPITHWSPTGGYTSPTANYEHRYRGIIAAHGPVFSEGTVEGMSIVDVLPTIMAALGESLSPDFDGEVRIDMLSTDPELQELDKSALPTPQMAAESGEDRERRERTVEKRLADLGYMD